MAFPRMQKDRLNKLIRLMEKTKMEEELSPNNKRSFDMGSFFHLTRVNPEIAVDENGECRVIEGFCETAACCLGTAALDRGFQRAGLKVRFDPTHLSRSVGAETSSTGSVIYYDNNTEEELEDFEAGARFFGLTLREAGYLFDPAEYTVRGNVTPKDTIKHIKEVLNGKFRTARDAARLSE